MSAITNVWRQLVQRRLWPVAILLVAAVAAVPLMLAKEPEPTAPAPAPAPVSDAADDALAEQPIVAQASAPVSGKRRKVVGDAKNPFGMPKKAKSASDTGPDSDGTVTTKTKTDTKSQAGDAPAGDGGTPTTPTAPSDPVAPTAPVEPEPKPKQYDIQELTVRFGGGDSAAARQSVKRREALPSADNPVLIYLGVLKDGKTAEFLVDHGIEPVGDGECRPTPEQCETVRLRAGETEFFDIKDESGNVVAQYQLDLVKIHRAGGSAARTSRRTASVATRRLRAALGATSAHLP